MPRVNVEAIAFVDPRFDRLARLLELPDADCARGKMVRVWWLCYENGVHSLDAADVADVLGVSDDEARRILLESRLGSANDDGSLRIKGTAGRIEWLIQKREAGKKGGEASKNKRAKGRASAKTKRGEADAKHNEADAKHNETNAEAESKHQPSSCRGTSKPPTLTPTLSSYEESIDADHEAAPTEPMAPPVQASLPSLGAARGQTRKNDSPPKTNGSRRRSTPKAPSTDHKCFVAFWDKLYCERTGSKPTWGAKAGKQVKQLLAAHSCAELERRAHRLFDGEHWFLKNGAAPTLGVFIQHIDALVEMKPRQDHNAPRKWDGRL